MADMFNPYNSSVGSSKSGNYIVGRVKRVVLGPNLTDTVTNTDYKTERDLGAIYFEPLYTNKSGIGTNANYSKPAYPLFSSIRQYPNIGEIVLIFPGPSSDMNDGASNQDLWYLPPFSIWGSVNANVFPNMSEYASFLSTQNVTGSSYPGMPNGYTFEERPQVKTLRPYEGDTIIQGRFGQSIRFGSTVTGLKSTNLWSKGESSNGSPITIITNSQKKFTAVELQSPTTVEDINRDGSSIYLTEDQEIVMNDLNFFPKRSYSLGQSVNPQIQEVVTIEKTPVSNEFVSAQDQDIRSNA